VIAQASLMILSRGPRPKCDPEVVGMLEQKGAPTCYALSAFGDKVAACFECGRRSPTNAAACGLTCIL
jgi:hypothetical protein